MKISPREHIQGILTKKGGPLEKIFAMYENQKLLEKAFYKDLPEAYASHAKFLLYKSGVMTIGVSNSAMLTRMSYEKPELLTMFKKNTTWAGLREIKVKIVV